jgi:hypothetical protein
LIGRRDEKRQHEDDQQVFNVYLVNHLLISSSNALLLRNCRGMTYQVRLQKIGHLSGGRIESSPKEQYSYQLARC